MNLFDKSKRTLTYVSSFANIDCKDPIKTLDWRLDNFEHMAKTGVPIVLYVDQDIQEVYGEKLKTFPNVVLKDVDYSKSFIYKVCEIYKNNLPPVRNMVKDSFMFLALIHMKPEFIANAVKENPFDTTHFAWIDFNLPHVFKEKAATTAYMHYLTTCKWNARFMANPGCWEKGRGNENFTDYINWRFCGGFLIGDAQSFLDLLELYLEYFPIFMHTYGVNTWEVNFWAWLEINTNWEVTWYKADHNDSIVRVPSHLFSTPIAQTTFRYILPEEPGFYPSSSSYIHVEGKHVLNVRYVNYTLLDYGRYRINHPQNFLESKNLRCYLSDDFKAVLGSDFVWEGMMGLKEYDKSISGLEDVRLYLAGNQLKYVATNKSYHKGQKVRIMTGNYSASMAMFETGQVLESPTDNYWEKNWIPLGIHGQKERFIYRWSPFEIGEIEGDTLKIVVTKPVEEIFLQGVRGSTTPVWSTKDNCFYCVVHYSEDIHGAKTLAYYHMLVKLDKDFIPFEWSDIFHFNKIGIQYCIGFTILEESNKFVFWFSENDGNPGFCYINA